MRLRSVLVLGAAAFAWLAPHMASADDACITAYEQTQTLRREGKVREARVQAIQCSADACPKALSRDCARWLSELDASIPSVVFEAKTPEGYELTNVRVIMDGKPLVEKVEGQAVQIEIGTHKFRFEPIGNGTLQPTELSVVIHEGEKNRKLSVIFKSARSTDRPVPFMTYVFGGLGLAGFGVGAAFGIKGLGKKSDLDGCKPNCAASDVNSMTTSFAIADIGLAVGVVASLAALYIFFSRPTEEPPSTSASLAPRVTASPTAGGATAAAIWTF